MTMTYEQIRISVLGFPSLYHEAREFGIAKEDAANPGNDRPGDDCMYDHLDEFITANRVRLEEFIRKCGENGGKIKKSV
jgi:hypothetical protein